MNTTNEQNSFEDDLSVQIHDLPADGPDPAVEVDAAPGAQMTTAATPVLRLRLPPAVIQRRRALQTGALVSLVLIALAVIFGSSPDLRGALWNSVQGHPSASLAPLPAGGDELYVVGTPPWGQLSIDGQAQEHLPIVGMEAPLRLSRGQHRLVWRAEPFAAQSCVLSLPRNYADTCRASSSAATPFHRNAPLLMFSATLANLSPPQRAALERQIQAGLDTSNSTDTVQPGELFVNLDAGPAAQGSLQAAAAPLRAHMRLALDADPSLQRACEGSEVADGCQLYGQDCRLLCSQRASLDSPEPASTVGPYWYVEAAVGLYWTYTTPGGQLIGASEPDELGTHPDMEHFLSLILTWQNGQWQSTMSGQFYTGPIPCASAQDETSTASILHMMGSGSTQSFEWEYISDVNLAKGCLLVITPQTAAGASEPSWKRSALFLHRFGVFLAVNPLAQHYKPDLPRATPYEQALARSLGAQIHLTV